MRHYARRVDSSQSDIVDAIRDAGWLVYIIEEPCDLLCFKAGRGFRTIEVKTANRKDGTARLRKDQQEQNEFCALTSTPRITSPEAAIEYLEKSNVS